MGVALIRWWCFTILSAVEDVLSTGLVWPGVQLASLS